MIQCEEREQITIESIEVLWRTVRNERGQIRFRLDHDHSAYIDRAKEHFRKLKQALAVAEVKLIASLSDGEQIVLDQATPREIVSNVGASFLHPST